MPAVRRFGLGAFAVLLGLDCLARLLRLLRSRRGGPRALLNEVLFFPVGITCVEHLFRPGEALPKCALLMFSHTPPHSSCPCPLPHGQETSFTRLLRHLLSASTSLDLCIFAFSNQSLSRAMLLLQARGVVVRVVTDKNYMAISGSQISALRRAGVDVRHEMGAVYMHHKFAVMDGRLLITGSLNWTTTAIQCNKENMLVTEEPDLVQPFIREFQRLWDSNDPARHCPHG